MRANPIPYICWTRWLGAGRHHERGRRRGQRIRQGQSLLRTDEVNHAAGTISKASSRGYNLIQGNNLTVTQVHPKTEVVRESHNVGEAMEDLRRLAEERLGKDRSRQRT